jgi:ribosomal protein S18 acetylase RimI-like enzyme
MTVQLVPMTDAELQAYLAFAIDNYAQEHVKAGNWLPEEAHEKSAKEFQHLLPDGVASKDQYLFSIQEVTSRQKIGMLWFAVTVTGAHRTAFIYDFNIDEAQRGKGYGRDALTALDKQAAAMGIESISLHVFAHNSTAIRLYEKMGYEVTDLHMTRKIKS